MSGRHPPRPILCTMQPWLLDRRCTNQSSPHNWIIHWEMVKPATKSENFVPGRGCDYFSDGNSHPNTPLPAQNWLIAQFDSLGWGCWLSFDQNSSKLFITYFSTSMCWSKSPIFMGKNLNMAGSHFGWVGHWLCSQWKHQTSSTGLVSARTWIARKWVKKWSW